MKLTTVKRLALLLLAAFALRLAAGLWWQSHLGAKFGFGDSESYWSLGRTIAAGEPYRYGSADSRVFRAPGYPVLLAPIFLLGGDDPSVFWARAEGALLGTLSVAGVWWLARRLFSPTAGWFAGLAAAVYPEAVATSVFVLSEASFCLLMLANLALWIAAWQTESPRRALWLAAAAGVTAGAATLVRPSWLLFTPFALGIGLAFGGKPGSSVAGTRGCLGHSEAVARRTRALGHCFAMARAPYPSAIGSPSAIWGTASLCPSHPRRHLLLGLAMAVGLVLVMTPWWIRNVRAVDRFVPTTLEVGVSLYDGLNPRADGSSHLEYADRLLEQERRHPSNPDDPLEVRLDRRMRDEALSWAWANPGRVVRLAGIKFLRIWNVWPNEASLSSWPVRLLIVMTYVPVLLLGILGVAKTIRQGWPYWLCWLPAVYFTLLHVVFVGSIRYRQPAVLGLIVLAAGWVAARRRNPSTTEG